MKTGVKGQICRLGLELSSVSPPQYLDPCTFDKELLLHRRFLDHRLILSPGKTFMCKEPGWFRLVFAARPHLLRSGEWS